MRIDMTQGDTVNTQKSPPSLSMKRGMGYSGMISTENPTISSLPKTGHINTAFESDTDQPDIPGPTETTHQHDVQQDSEQHNDNTATTEAQQNPSVHFPEKAKEEEEKEEVSDRDKLRWDVFRYYPYDTNVYACEGLIKILTKVLKVVFIIISFLLILTSLVTSKLAILYATSNLNQDVSFRQNNEFDDSEDVTRWGVPVKYVTPGCKERDVVRWLWCVLLCMCTPYILTFLTSIWTILFKTKNSPTWRALCMVLGMETLHTFGIMMLFFLIIPYMDIFRGLFLMSATSLLPSFFKLFTHHKKEEDTHPKKKHHRVLNIIADVVAFLFQLAPLVLFPALTVASYPDADTMAPHYENCSIESYSQTVQPTTYEATTTYEVPTTSLGMFTDYMDNMTTNDFMENMTTNDFTTGDYTNDFTDYNESTEVPFSTTLYQTTSTMMTSIPTTAPDAVFYCSAAQNNSKVMYGSCEAGRESVQDPAIYLIPLALLLISASWWQNFVDKHMAMKCAPELYRLAKEVKKSKTKIWAAVSIWKLVLSFGLFCLGMFVWYPNTTDDDIEYNIFDALFGKTLYGSSAFHDHQYMNNANTAFETDWLIVFVANAVSGLVGYFISVNAIQANVQTVTYSCAILAATPFTFIIALFGFCGCQTDGKMADALNVNDIYWNCYDGFPSFKELILERPIVIVGLAWWIGQLILTRHLWMPRIERIASTDRIFVQPMYCGMLLEQSFALNRSRHDKHKAGQAKLPRYLDGVTVHDKSDDRPEKVRHKIDDDLIHTDHDSLDEHDDMDGNLNMEEDILYDRPDLKDTMIFICATMWHETEREMLSMIKSIIRLDKDQGHKRLGRDYFHIRVPQYYDFEGHIFFDDAFKKYIPGDLETFVNSFVALFVRIIDEATSYVHGANVVLDPPEKIPTPYGGKLLYRLPGGNKLYLHLKDKQKIRHRKRWSQVMYMYYLLGHRLWNKKLKRSTKTQVAQNTYLLTLDGDVDFKPEAVMLLVDLMRRSKGVGAACGRIHPAGSGPMVWYQKFEYAISHWLQKTTEHVLGCVLCSPGCFSLFRASALMDDNIMKTYSQTAEEALHYVQYDQGEDRWLCTLLLQRGYRVEYSAAADALTYAPEGFNEFFNQRRRWTPSTFANIMDLLSTGGATAKRNENISLLYIIYQGGLMFSSVLGPATIFLMVVSAFDTVFPGVEMGGAFIMVLIPVGVYFALCLLAKSSVQLAFGALLAGLFGIAQMVVLVGLIVAIVNDGLCSPTAWFLLGTTAIFVIAGILHPQEMTVLIYGILYFLLIPTMYLLLIIYSLCNMHVVSWGTREVVQTEAEKERLKQREIELAVGQAGAGAAIAGAKPGAPAPQSGVKGMLGGMFGGGAASASEDGWTWSCGDICRCMCCPKPGESITDATISKAQKNLTIVTSKIDIYSSQNGDAAIPLKKESRLREEDMPDPDYDTDTSDVPEVKYDPAKPHWTQDINSVGKGPVGAIGEKEEEFWGHLIRRYLLPIDQNPEREERIKKELLSLRNKAVIGFFMIDLLFITLIQTVQTIPVATDSNPDDVNATIPDPGYYFEFTCVDPVTHVARPQQIEPIGFAFLMVFGLFLIIQFLGMLWHRLFSMIQIVSSTDLRDKKSNKNLSYMKLIETMAKLGESETPDSGSVSSGLDSRRQSIQSQGGDESDVSSRDKLVNSHVVRNLKPEQKVYKTMDKIFAQRFLAMRNQINDSPVGTDRPERPAAPIRRQLSNRHFNRPPSRDLEAGVSRHNSSAHTPRVNRSVSRRRTRAQTDAMSDIARRRSDIFRQEKADQLKRDFNLSDRDIEHEEAKLRHILPPRNLSYSPNSQETEVELTVINSDDSDRDDVFDDTVF